LTPPLSLHDALPICCDRCRPARFRDVALAAGRLSIAQELERDRTVGRLIVRTPNLGALIAAMERREAITTRDELLFLSAFGDMKDRKSTRLNSSHVA